MAGTSKTNSANLNVNVTLKDRILFVLNSYLFVANFISLNENFNELNEICIPTAFNTPPLIHAAIFPERRILTLIGFIEQTY